MIYPTEDQEKMQEYDEYLSAAKALEDQFTLGNKCKIKDDNVYDIIM